MKWFCLIGCFVSMFGATISIGIIRNGLEMNTLLGIYVWLLGGILFCSNISFMMANLENFLKLNEEK